MGAAPLLRCTDARPAVRRPLQDDALRIVGPGANEDGVQAVRVEHSHMPEDPQSSFRRWRVVLLFGVLLFVVLVAVREFVGHRSNSPIVDQHVAVINDMSWHSPRARQRLEQYYAKHQRQTVASKHYPRLCHEMQQLAFDDGLWLAWPCPVLFNLYEEPRPRLAHP